MSAGTPKLCALACLFPFDTAKVERTGEALIEKTVSYREA